MEKLSFKVGQLVAHRTAPKVPWVTLAGVDAGHITARRVCDDGEVQNGEFFAVELAPYTDEVAELAERLVERLRADDFPASLVEAAEMLHDDIADELDTD